MEEMSLEPTPLRNPLGLPKGSVRALLALLLFGSSMSLLILGRVMDQELWLVNYVILGYYFASRQDVGHTDTLGRKSQPLGLPKGTIRFLLIFSFVATVALVIFKAYQMGYTWPWNSVAGKKKIWEHTAFLPILSLGAFFLGRMLRPLGKAKSAPSSFTKFFQDGKAIVALVGAVLVVSIVVFQLPIPESKGIKQFFLTFILFYFGGR